MHSTLKIESHKLFENFDYDFNNMISEENKKR